jgi:hypothetical protein
MIKINIAKEFTELPEGKVGQFSGKEFRETLLIPRLKEAIKQNAFLEINLDGGYGYSPSFIEEAFGGMIRHWDGKIHKTKLIKYIKIISMDEPHWIDKIKQYIKEGSEKALNIKNEIKHLETRRYDADMIIEGNKENYDNLKNLNLVDKMNGIELLEENSRLKLEINKINTEIKALYEKLKINREKVSNKETV